MASSSSSAVGPDGLTHLHLRHFGPKAIQYLTDLYNLSVSRADIPAIWKEANIIPIPKPGKPAGVSTSYRPISLLSPCIKVLERLLLPSCTAAFDLAPTQHGFRPLHSTTTALLPMANRVAQGFNDVKPPRRTAVVSVDISKAFDSVHPDLLLEKISRTNLHHNLVRWLNCLLRGRTASCLYDGVRSKRRVIHTGTPQGGVLSPILFNFFIADCPQVLQIQPSYADDMYFCDSNSDVSELGPSLTAALVSVKEWADRNKLVLAPEKSSVTLFTPDTHQSKFHPHVMLGGTRLELDRQPKFLGVTWDTHFSFGPHIEALRNSASRRLAVLKSVASADWGSEIGLLVNTFKMYVRSSLSYAAGVWGPVVKEGLIRRRLQPIQNQALRVVTGCHRMASGDHVHQETEELPVLEHTNMLCAQFLASALREDHPSYATVTSPPGPRNMKSTLHQRFIGEVRPLMDAGAVSLSNSEYGTIRKQLHTSAVSRHVARRPINPVINAQPPKISPSILRLPRQTQRVLSQLRSGHCSKLAAYRERVGMAASAICPDCQGAPQTPAHLFECPSFPTTLTPLDLWTNPIRAATFLSSTPSFSDLALAPPPPPPPLSPPPPVVPPLPPPFIPPLLSPPPIRGPLTPPSSPSSLFSSPARFSSLSFSLSDFSP